MNVPYDYKTEHQQSFESLKNMTARNTCLRYYDHNQDVTLEVDSSMKGIEAVLIQNNLPIAFGSKSLTSAQANYSVNV